MRPAARWATSVAVLVIAVDQLVKWLVLDALLGSAALFRQIAETRISPPSTEITGFFQLTIVANTGVSFGLFSGNVEAVRWALVAVAGVICLALALWLRRVERPVLAVAIGLVIGGALGNVIDRLIYGAVVDFLDFHVMGYHWPSFNVADSAITIGVIVLLFDSLFGGQPVTKAPHQRDLP